MDYNSNSSGHKLSNLNKTGLLSAETYTPSRLCVLGLGIGSADRFGPGFGAFLVQCLLEEYADLIALPVVFSFPAEVGASAATDAPAKADEPAKAEEDHNDPTNTHTGESSVEPSHTKSDKLENIRPPPPFPQRLKKQKHDYQFKKFFDILKQVHINLPLVEALQQMPNYVNFSTKIPAKKTDPGSFTIECSIGHNYSTKALCDPGASINLMPKSVFQKLNIGEAKPTTVMLQLADHSFVQPEGKIEDILVQVDKFIFPADFLILDCEADKNAPIILGRPFLSTSRAIIDFDKDEIVFKVDDDQIKIKALKKQLEQKNKGKGITPTEGTQ
ncbi:hypothetical protein V6N13_101430 [Hibiscus sabdariffa]|uniref:Aspartic peptidase DDI1-type domain-containing protein n=1 Tax=Hibiscus sabdariffa TaxID=183260 RepID=A0ABR2QLF3_9ROSI